MRKEVNKVIANDERRDDSFQPEQWWLALLLFCDESSLPFVLIGEIKN
jgi:hypothetical protein